MERVSKQVIVMRTKYPKGSVRKGKMIAQGAHASLAAVLSMSKGSSDSITIYLEDPRTGKPDSAMRDWLRGKFTKVCVQASSQTSEEQEKEITDLYEAAKEKGIPCSLIVDSGLTEFDGIPTKTCCAIGPAWSDEVDEITGKLGLL